MSIVRNIFSLRSRLQHILDEYLVPSGRVIHQHMGDCTDNLPVLDNGTAAHADVK